MYENGEKIGKKKIREGIIDGMTKEGDKYVVLCETPSCEQEIIFASEKTLDELNPIGKNIDATAKIRHIKTTRTTLHGGYGRAEE